MWLSGHGVHHIRFVSQVVIFSQFTSFLDIMQAALTARAQALEGPGGKIARLDGSMTRVKRSLAISSFTDDADVSKISAEILLVVASGLIGPIH